MIYSDKTNRHPNAIATCPTCDTRTFQYVNIGGENHLWACRFCDSFLTSDDFSKNFAELYSQRTNEVTEPLKNENAISAFVMNAGGFLEHTNRYDPVDADFDSAVCEAIYEAHSNGFLIFDMHGRIYAIDGDDQLSMVLLHDYSADLDESLRFPK